jgi:type IV pilus assembly protein PilQ
MEGITYKYPRGGLPAVLLTAVLIFGCSSKITQPDPFLEKWSTMADTSAGSSPVARSRSDVRRMNCFGMEAVEKEVGDVKKDISAKRLLPDNRISLKMNKSDIKVVLRSLARVVGLNIIVGGKNEVKGEVTVDFRDVPWDQAFTNLLRAHQLTYSWNDEIIMIKTSEDKKDDLAAKNQEVELQQLDRLVTCVIPIYYITLKPSPTVERKFSAKSALSSTDTGRTSDLASTGASASAQSSSEITQNLASFMTGPGSIGVEPNTNSLIIQATQNDIKRLLSIIETLDKPSPQIQIKANIVETTKQMARQLGIQWGGMYAQRVGNESIYVTPGGTIPSSTTGGTAASAPTPRPLSGAYTPTAGGPYGIAGQGFAANFPADLMTAAGAGSLGLIFGTIGGNLLEMQLNALQKDSKLNILSSPSITTLDNQTAFTENGERVPVNTQSVSQGTVSNTVTYIDAVLRLEIKPHVIDDKTLSMKIIVKKDEVDTTRQVQGNPYIIKKQTETNLIVGDGETIVISGLTKQRTGGGDTGIPGLKDVPVLGWLFKSDDKVESMEEVLIFITSTILPPDQVMAAETKQGRAPAGPMGSADRQ